MKSIFRLPFHNQHVNLYSICGIIRKKFVLYPTINHRVPLELQGLPSFAAAWSHRNNSCSWKIRTEQLSRRREHIWFAHKCLGEGHGKLEMNILWSCSVASWCLTSISVTLDHPFVPVTAWGSRWLLELQTSCPHSKEEGMGMGRKLFPRMYTFS